MYFEWEHNDVIRVVNSLGCEYPFLRQALLNYMVPFPTRISRPEPVPELPPAFKAIYFMLRTAWREWANPARFFIEFIITMEIIAVFPIKRPPF